MAFFSFFFVGVNTLCFIQVNRVAPPCINWSWIFLSADICALQMLGQNVHCRMFITQKSKYHYWYLFKIHLPCMGTWTNKSFCSTVLTATFSILMAFFFFFLLKNIPIVGWIRVIPNKAAIKQLDVFEYQSSLHCTRRLAEMEHFAIKVYTWKSTAGQWQQRGQVRNYGTFWKLSHSAWREK